MTVLARAGRVSLWALVLALGGLTCWRSARALALGGISPDFFYYLVTARDWMRLAPGEMPNPTWYSYAPGVFHVYQALLWAGLTSVPSLAAALNAASLLDALLVGAILLRGGVRPLVSAWACVWALFVAEHHQGYGGLTEPLVALPFLLALALTARPSRHFAEGYGWAALALGLGLSLYVKQQAVLYVVAAAAAIAFTSGGLVRGLYGGLRLGALASAVFLGLVALEPGPIGDALTPMIRMTLGYDAQAAAPWDSLGGRLAADPKLAWLLGGLVLALLALLLSPRGRRALSQPRGALFALAGLSALASALQVVKRPYPHYLLMVWPCIVIAYGLVMAAVLRRLLRPAREWRYLAAGMLLAAPFCRLGGHPGPWLVPFSLISSPLQARADLVRELPPVRDALARIRTDLGPDAFIVVLPPRHNEVYWYLDYRHPLGEYRWPDLEGDFLASPRFAPEVQAALEAPRARGVVFLNTPEMHASWVGAARAAGFTLPRRSGPVLWLRRP